MPLRINMENLEKIQFDSYKEYGDWIWKNYDRTYQGNREIEIAGLMVDILKENPKAPCLTGVTFRLLTNEEFANSKFCNRPGSA